MNRVLLVATTTGYQTRSFGEAAEKLGVRLTFATDRCDRIDDPWCDHAVPIRFHEEERSTAAIVDAVRTAPIDGIVAVGDRPTVIAARVAEALGLPGNPPAAAQASRNKLTSRLVLNASGLTVPWFHAVPAARDPRQLTSSVRYPCVVKPLAMSGSRGVIRANDAEEFVAAFTRVARLLRQPDVRSERDTASDTVMFEAFIPGREFALEGLLNRGVLQTLAIFDKPDPLDGPFFEEAIYVTPPRLTTAEQSRISATVAAAARALGLRHGPVHAEVRVNEMGVYVLEVAARPIGGLCSRALRFVDGASLEELLLRHAIGENVSDVAREARASGVMMIPIPSRGFYRGVAGVDEAWRVAGIDDIRITAKRDQRLVPLPEGKSYLGFIFASGDTPEAVTQALRDAHARLTFDVAAEMPMYS
jgi:biotin carboxylase